MSAHRPDQHASCPDCRALWEHEEGIRVQTRISIAAEIRDYPRDICCCPHDDPCDGDYAGCAACWDLTDDDECFGGTHRHVAMIIRGSEAV